MMFKVFAIYDSAVQVWRTPIFARSKGEIMRSWIEACNKQDTDFGKYPDDYTLFEVGTFDDSCCKLDMYLTPDRIGLGREFVNLKPVEPLVKGAGD